MFTTKTPPIRLWRRAVKTTSRQGKISQRDFLFFNNGKSKRLKISIALLTLASWSLGAGWGSAFAACPGDPKFNRQSIIQFSGDVVPAIYHHDVTTAQIEAMRLGRYHAGLMHNPGLTLSKHEFETNYQIGGSRRGGSREVCLWVDLIKVQFNFTHMDVYLSSQYAEGTCAYKVILDHENQHVAINTRVYRKYRALMLSALKRDRTIPTKRNPLDARSMEQGKAVITARINQLLKPIEAGFVKEAAAENARIDTIANYKRTQAKCKEW